MGQAMRVIKYDRAANERNAISALRFPNSETNLSWFRLDDGVMGGQSDTQHHAQGGENSVLHFEGMINTEGGGFTSIRSPIPKDSLKDFAGVRLHYQGDGKTYKFLLSDGKSGGPMAKSPSWQIDIPTKSSTSQSWETVDLMFDGFLPNFVGRDPLREKDAYTLHPSEMVQIGLMLSLKLSNGQPNPKETFGEGVFPFQFRLKAIEGIAK